jgi:hypothetical protein
MGATRRLRFLATATAATLILSVAFAAPASAITDGELDGVGHPYVALMLAKGADGNPLWRCSGTLISPSIYLTAGHCTEAPAAQAEIFLSTGPILTDPNYTSVGNGGTGCANPAVTGYPCDGDASGTPYTHPDYDPDRFFYRDLGIVVLDAPVALGEYGALPVLNQLDALKTERGKKDVTFTAVGYGLQASFPDAAAWKDEAVKVRMVAHPKLNQINVPGFHGRLLAAALQQRKHRRDMFRRLRRPELRG